jgi:hypothetical protein
MSESKKSTIGQAIDQALGALSTLDKREQQIVISTVCSLLDIALSSQKPAPLPAHASPQPHATAPQTAVAPAAAADKLAETHRRAPQDVPVEHGLDIRSLKNLKQPANAIQMACVAAFYLQEHAPEDERTKELTSADLERLFKQAGFKLPSRIQQVLPDAKSAGYFESIDRGKYKLTRVGYNLVTHSLPRASAA